MRDHGDMGGDVFVSQREQILDQNTTNLQPARARSR